MKTIYNVYVPIESQVQADRMKQICIDYGLPYWESDIAFLYNNECDIANKFLYFDGDFALWVDVEHTQVTESEFLELVKMLKK